MSAVFGEYFVLRIEPVQFRNDQVFQAWRNYVNLLLAVHYGFLNRTRLPARRKFCGIFIDAVDIKSKYGVEIRIGSKPGVDFLRRQIIWMASLPFRGIAGIGVNFTRCS